MLLELLTAALVAAGPQASSGPPATAPVPARGDAPAAATAPPMSAGLEGTWRGRVTDETGEQSIVLYITVRKGQLAASLDSPERRALGLSVTHLRRDGRQISFSLPASQATFEGELSADGSTISGVWTRNGRTAETDFVRDSRR
jgi:hypothetical protein